MRHAAPVAPVLVLEVNGERISFTPDESGALLRAVIEAHARARSKLAEGPLPAALDRHAREHAHLLGSVRYVLEKRRAPDRDSPRIARLRRRHRPAGPWNWINRTVGGAPADAKANP